MISALVVGCGAIGSEYDAAAAPGAAPRSHAGAYSASSRTSLSGGVDPDPAARTRFTERWGVPSCDASGVPMQVNFLRRFDPLHRRVAELVRGRVLRADFRFSGTLENYGSHAIDLFRWFVGEPVQVARETETSGELRVTTADARVGSFARVADSTLPFFDCDLWLDDARVTLSAFGEQLLVARPSRSAIFAGLERFEFDPPDPETGLEHAMAAGLDSLLDHLERGDPLQCTGADGLAELRVRTGALT
jgi:predicted dehydrogenase